MNYSPAGDETLGPGMSVCERAERIETVLDKITPPLETEQLQLCILLRWAKNICYNLHDS